MPARVGLRVPQLLVSAADQPRHLPEQAAASAFLTEMRPDLQRPRGLENATELLFGSQALDQRSESPPSV